MIWQALKSKNAALKIPEPYLESERVYLRPPRLSDWGSWREVRARNQSYLKPYEPTWAENCLEQDYFERRINGLRHNWANDKSYSFLIFKQGDESIGGMNINHICRGSAQYGSLGYWIDEGHQGQGYMREALQLTIKFAFDHLGLHRLNAACLTDNERSKNLVQRAGFKEEGLARKYLRINGLWQDHILYGLSIEDWQTPEAI